MHICTLLLVQYMYICRLITDQPIKRRYIFIRNKQHIHTYIHNLKVNVMSTKRYFRVPKLIYFHTIKVLNAPMPVS